MKIHRIEQDSKGRNIAIDENGEILGYAYVAVPSEVDRDTPTLVSDEGE